MSNSQFIINPASSPSAPYTTQQNPNYGLYNSDGQFIFGQSPDISNTYVSPASLPSFPIQAGGNASQLTSNHENKSVFTALNLQQEQVRAGKRTLNGPIFKSYREQMAYIQAQYTQPLPKQNPAATQPPTATTPTTVSVSTPTQTIYSTSTLFDMYT
jgi:hypothetical protein